MATIKTIRCDLCHKEFRTIASEWFRCVYKYTSSSIWARSLDFCSDCYEKMRHAKEPVIVHDDGRQKKDGAE